MNIAILPTQKILLNDNLFDISTSRDNVLERFVLLKEALESKEHTCHTVDKYNLSDVDVLIFSRFDYQVRDFFACIKENPYIKFIYTANEESVVCLLHSVDLLGQLPVDIVLTWNDSAVKKYNSIQKSNIGQPMIRVDSISNIAFNKKKLCCMISGNKRSDRPNELYSERLKAIRYFSKSDSKFDLYGVGWNLSTDPVIKKVYKGTVVSKKETMQYYKFAICYENMKNENGSITEKIFDCFAAGSIPVYYGASNVTDYIPKKCFIDFRDFVDYDELYSFMKNMEEIEYNEYLKAVKKFLQTNAYNEFTSEAYVRNMMRVIEDLKCKKGKRNFYKVKLDLIRHVINNMGFYMKNLRGTRRFIFDVLTVW